MRPRYAVLECEEAAGARGMELGLSGSGNEIDLA